MKTSKFAFKIIWPLLPFVTWPQWTFWPPQPSLFVYIVIECPLGEAAAAWSELELLSTLQPLASVAVASVASSEDGKGKAFPTWAWKITLGWGTIKWQKELPRERKVLSRVISRFFMEVGHETTWASI